MSGRRKVAAGGSSDPVKTGHRRHRTASAACQDIIKGAFDPWPSTSVGVSTRANSSPGHSAKVALVEMHRHVEGLQCELAASRHQDNFHRKQLKPIQEQHAEELAEAWGSAEVVKEECEAKVTAAAVEAWESAETVKEESVREVAAAWASAEGVREECKAELASQIGEAWTAAEATKEAYVKKTEEVKQTHATIREVEVERWRGAVAACGRVRKREREVKEAAQDVVEAGRVRADKKVDSWRSQCNSLEEDMRALRRENQDCSKELQSLEKRVTEATTKQLKEGEHKHRRKLQQQLREAVSQGVEKELARRKSGRRESISKDEMAGLEERLRGQHMQELST